MNPHFAFSGKIGSGKTAVSKLFASRMGARWNSFGNTVKRIAEDRHVTPDREALQNLGAELVSICPDAFCRRVINEANPKHGSFLVIDGVRHAAILERLKVILHPTPVVSIFVEVHEPVRLERIRRRGVPGLQELKVFESHSTEIQVMTSLRKSADLCVDNSLTLEVAIARIQEWFNSKLKVG
jgi:dephospho-CoA kinase